MARERRRTGHRVVREPVQVYLTPDDSALLVRLANEAGLSKAEVLRRGVRSYAREVGTESPMLRFAQESDPGTAPEGVAEGHDAVLAEAYRGPERARRKRQ